jgi:hypothetical protein
VGTIRIEPEPSTKESLCADCGGITRLVHGYVYDEREPSGLYFVEWCDGDHPDRAAWLTISLGRFAEGSASADRRSFCVQWRAKGMSLTEQPARDNPDLLGPFVPRERALELPSVERLWHVADHVVSDDPRVADVGRWVDGAA